MCCCSLLERKEEGGKVEEEFGLGILSQILIVSLAMDTTLSQTVTTIIFVYLLFAGPFSSSAQPDQLINPPLGSSSSSSKSPPPPDFPTSPLNNELSNNPPNDNLHIPAPYLDPLVSLFQPPPPPPVKSIDRKSPSSISREFQNGTREWVSSNTGKLNKGKKVGLVFLVVAVVLQIVLGGFLMYKRRKIANL